MGSQEADTLHRIARTNREYFLDIPPDPPESEIKALFERLDKLRST